MISTLKNRSEFLRLRKSPRFSSDCFIVQGEANNNENSTDIKGLKVGYTVTKKVGNAVERNRIKRRLKHAMVQAMPHSTMGQDNNSNELCAQINIIAHRKTLNAPYKTLISNLTKGIDRIVSKGTTRAE